MEPTKKKSPFDFVNAINKRNDIVNTTDDPREAMIGYVPFVVNRTLSYHLDTLNLVAILNLTGTLDPKMQYDFLINTVRPRARYGSWAKAETKDDLELVAKYYECRVDIARQYMPLVTPDMLEVMKQSINGDGVNGQ